MLTLRLLATSDLHAHVLPYDYFRDRPDGDLGLARLATLIRAARAEVRNCMLLDCGDLIQGSPMGDFVAMRGCPVGAVHPMIAAMTAVGYDGGTLGNHDFNFGLGFLEAAMTGAAHPLVCANVARADGTALVPPWIVTERTILDEAGRSHRLKIGIIGFVPPQILQWDKALLLGRVVVRDMVEAAREHVPEMRRAGADLVVALCHTGIAAGERRGGEENAATHLAAVEGIDALVLGHQHLLFPGARDFAGITGVDAARGALHGKPAVMPGAFGGHLGLIDLSLSRSEGGWTVSGFRVELRRPGPKDAPDAAVAAAVAADHEATLAHVRAPVGRCETALHSYFALVGDVAATRLVADAQAWYAAQLLRGGPHAGLPLLSAVAPFKAGGRGGPRWYTDIPAGPLAVKDIADLYVFPNTVRALRLSGTALREWLEFSASLYRRIDPDAAGEQELVNPRFPSYQSDVIFGLTYRIDVSRPARYGADGDLLDPRARRVRDLAFKGEPVRDSGEFVVVTNSYRADGGGPGVEGACAVLEAPDLTRDVLMRYVREQGSVAPHPRGDWSLLIPAGAQAVFSTGPGAAGQPPPGLAATVMGPAPGGFVKYRLAGAAGGRPHPGA